MNAEYVVLPIHGVVVESTHFTDAKTQAPEA